MYIGKSKPEGINSSYLISVFYKIIDGEDERWGIAGYSSSYDS